MPVVHVVIRPDWLPTNEQIASKCIGRNHRFNATQRLLDNLRALVASSITVVDGAEITAKQVVLHVSAGSRWSQNVPPWWIDVQPGELNGTPRQQEDRRTLIYQTLRDKIIPLVVGLRDRPDFDIEVRPINGSGGSVQGGRETMIWGAIVPDEATL